MDKSLLELYGYNPSVLFDVKNQEIIHADTTKTGFVFKFHVLMIRYP